MGVYHFMGLGKTVGAVTCAVDYIEKALDAIAADTATDATRKLFCGSGGISHTEQDKGKIEALVLFTSKEVIDGSLEAREYAGNNKPGPVRRELESILRQVWTRTATREGQKIFWCAVDIDDFQDCFEKVLNVTYRFSSLHKQGKEIWCNLTGGTNAINMALLSMARLTGKSTKHYLISQQQDYREHVRVPPSIQTISPDEDGYLHVLPFLKTGIDIAGFYEILLELESLAAPVTTKELLNRLRSQHKFSDISFEEFKDQKMLRLYGLGYTTFEKGLNAISESGRQFIHENLETLLELEGKVVRGAEDIVEESKNWRWFTEEALSKVSV